MTAWRPAKLFGDESQRRFRVTIGPAGGRRGYTAITGQVSWGIAFYVNGHLIPEIFLLRGVEYEFEVYAGDDAGRQARFHPLYLTEDMAGGFGQKNPSDQAQEKYDNLKHTQVDYS